MLIDINGDGLPDRVFDHNPEADDQPGFFVYLNTGDGLVDRYLDFCQTLDRVIRRR
jgi:hypothetical protein